MTLSAIQEVKNVSPQRFRLKDNASVEVGWFLQRSGTTSALEGAWMPEAELYASNAGTTRTIGVMPYTRSKVYASTDDLYQVGATREKEREISPITQLDYFGKNLGTELIRVGDKVSPAISGFQKTDTSKYIIGEAYEDIAVGKSGLVRLNMDMQSVSA